MPEPVVSLSVVCYNSASELRETLAAVMPDVASGFAELIVVDNASPDHSAELIEREFPHAHLVRTAANLGFAGGCNLAWPHVRGKYWMLLNPDVKLAPGALRDLVGFMERNPELGVVSPAVVVPGTAPVSARRFPSIARSTLELLRLHLLLPESKRRNLYLGAYYDGRDHLDVDWVPGTALLVQCDVVRAAGSLSPDLFMYGEDMEWCWRIRRAGWRVGVCASVVATHVGSASADRTWGESGRTLRVLTGYYRACEIMHGRLYTRILISVSALAAAVEALHPRRAASQRQKARSDARMHLGLLGGAYAERR